LKEQTVTNKPTFILTLRPLRDGANEIRTLRFVLKRLLRQHGLRCITLRELHDNTEQDLRNGTPPPMRTE
jgi:hypothetical protein